MVELELRLGDNSLICLFSGFSGLSEIGRRLLTLEKSVPDLTTKYQV